MTSQHVRGSLIPPTQLAGQYSLSSKNAIPSGQKSCQNITRSFLSYLFSGVHFEDSTSLHLALEGLSSTSLLVEDDTPDLKLSSFVFVEELESTSSLVEDERPGFAILQLFSLAEDTCDDQDLIYVRSFSSLSGRDKNILL